MDRRLLSVGVEVGYDLGWVGAATLGRILVLAVYLSGSLRTIANRPSKVLTYPAVLVVLTVQNQIVILIRLLRRRLQRVNRALRDLRKARTPYLAHRYFRRVPLVDSCPFKPD